MNGICDSGFVTDEAGRVDGLVHELNPSSDIVGDGWDCLDPPTEGVLVFAVLRCSS